MRGLLSGLGLSLILAALGAVVAAPARADAPPVRIALVDIARVNNEYNQLAAKRNEMQQWFQQQQAYLDELETKYSYLSEQHFNEILDILRMPRPLPAASAKRQKELRDLNDQKESRFLELQAKVDRSPKEQDEFNQLQETLDGRAKQINGIKDGLKTQLTQKQNDAQASVVDNMEKAVQDVATAGGYQLVLNKVFVLFGGDDITDAVLQKLNGAPPAKGTTPPAKPAGAGPAPAPAATP